MSQSVETAPTRPDQAPLASLRIRRHDGSEVAADPGRWARAYEQVYAEALDLSDHNDPPIEERLQSHAERPGFGLLAALDGDTVAGYVYGYTLQPDTLWWDGLTPSPAAEFVREDGRRTVGVCELLVAAPWRRFHLGATLVSGFLAERTEQRAAALIAETNNVVLGRYSDYGFTRVGTMEPYPGWRPHHMIVRDLTHRPAATT
ncbi:GNAT family N-acetyltransferase [Streptomyces alkaliterrae]|uniref:GNAT family N-acetyltransferase n=1 Tax=Streptomyces alkaliterrae TaxID=2213162 RepID=A0A5P0YSE8_9ACTN|nr:GNAT family N-acetyltransferase [Streptomyces alkaliterrae]MBB1256640.1 GNAT family N-acetyltransferase [Streptomyces alkaliterrae]MQS03251.1 GNAT family N-acetyltransferase [Streptomyces alkaliterrae]